MAPRHFLAIVALLVAVPLGIAALGRAIVTPPTPLGSALALAHFQLRESGIGECKTATPENSWSSGLVNGDCRWWQLVDEPGFLCSRVMAAFRVSPSCRTIAFEADTPPEVLAIFRATIENPCAALDAAGDRYRSRAIARQWLQCDRGAGTRVITTHVITVDAFRDAPPLPVAATTPRTHEVFGKTLGWF